MSVSAAASRPSAPPTAAHTGDFLDAALKGVDGALVRLEPGRVASLTVALPGHLIAESSLPGADCGWIESAQHLRLHGRGQALRLEETNGDAFRQRLDGWQRLSPDSRPPVCFFTHGAATAQEGLDLWLPKVTLSQHEAGNLLTFSAVGGEPVASILQGWKQDALRLLAPGPGKAEQSEITALATSPDAEHWQQLVTEATKAIAHGRFDKVVLARRLCASLSRPVSPGLLAKRLAALHPDCCVFVLPHDQGSVLAASPERLAVKQGATLTSHALAGTARRSGTASEDARARAQLLASPKERREHALVVEDIAARMAGFCDSVSYDESPSVMELRFVQHLWTRVEGHLKPGTGLLDAVARLHPTPAVLGLPPAAARTWLAEVQEQRDGLYTGVAGWIDAEGDGSAAVVLRSAYIEDCTAVLWAGAGIMADSEPEAEFAETEMKFAAMLEVLRA